MTSRRSQNVTRDPPPTPPLQAKGVAGKRRGIVLVAALVAFAVVVATLFGILQLVVAHARQQRSEVQSIQSAYLADAGIARAQAQLRGDATYRGETWLVPAEMLDGNDVGKVVIEIALTAGNANRMNIKSQADFPDDPFRRARTVRKATFSLTKE
jgi:type II secretory pathway component PulK